MRYSVTNDGCDDEAVRYGAARRAESYAEGATSRPRRPSATRLAATLILVLLAAAAAAAQRRGSYSNPVAPGDFPDPSVIRVGADYWAAATSSEWAPEFPLLHSRDLVNWEVVGSIFNARPSWSVGNYWAPELSEYRGRFYAYYVARKQGGSLCVAVATAQRPTGPYTDHGPLVCQEVGSIDGFPVTDEQGRRFLLWKEDGNSVSKPTPIWAQQLSADGTRLVGERREILRNDQPWEKHATLPYGDLIEGPAIVRKDGWFYMFYSGNFCCARECNYMLGVARARKLLGPWEKNPRNPILAGNETWKCPGHGTVLEDADGRHWLMYHAYNAKDFVYVGRQAMLDEVVWGADGWPTINDGRGPSVRAVSPHGTRGVGGPRSFFDDFNTLRLGPGWQWPQSNVPRFQVVSGQLLLSPTIEAEHNPAAAVLARTTTTGDYVATTVVDMRGVREAEFAGLSAYGDAENSLGISVDNKKVVILWRREKNEYKESILTDSLGTMAQSGAVQLRMTAREGHLYRFAVSDDGRTWKDVGEEIDGSYLPPWDRGVRVALVAGGARGVVAGRFGFLCIEPSR
ncbi:MAG: xylan 1,4-beta-xylosidase [Acidobacteriota bacterium]|jgi:beta-xylosidase|nr:xylan 1,4-beta-xylosidase [Acidobacteriota bacterium]